MKKINDIKTSIKGLNLKGLNVTIPYKKVIKYVDKVDKIADALQAVNTINNKGGILEGYNTDVEGFMLGLKNLAILMLKNLQ